MSKSPTPEASKAIAQQRTYDAALDLVKDIRNIATLDPDGGTKEIVLGAIDRIASSETLDDLFDASEKASGLDSLKNWEFLGETVVVLGFRIRRGAEKFRNATGCYVAIDIVNPRGEVETISTGADNVVSFLRQAERLGAFNEGSYLSLRFVSRETEQGALLFVKRA